MLIVTGIHVTLKYPSDGNDNNIYNVVIVLYTSKEQF